MRMATYDNVSVRELSGNPVITGATAEDDGQGKLIVESSTSPTLNVGETYRIDGDPDLSVNGELMSQGGGKYSFKVD